jgi:hypothetical protein
MVAAGYAVGDAWADLRQARASLDDVQRDVAAADARIATLQATRGAEGTMGARAVWSLEAPPPRVVGEIARALPRDVRLEALTLRYGSELEVEMTLTARNPAAYEAFLDALESSPSFAGIAPGDESRDDAVRASVRARFGGVAP